MVLFHKVLLIDLIIGELTGIPIPDQPLAAAETDIPHLGYRRHMTAILDGAMQILHLPGLHHLHEIRHM